MTGGVGRLGVITRGVFRLHPLPKITRTFSVSAGNLEATQQALHVVQNSKLAHTAMQVRATDDAAPETDVLFEGTAAGLAAQETQLKKLLELVAVTEIPPTALNARNDLWLPSASAAIIKFSVLPANIANGIETVRRVAAHRQIR